MKIFFIINTIFKFNIFFMRYFLYLLIFVWVWFFSNFDIFTYAGIFEDTTIPYCQWEGTCWIDKWLLEVENLNIAIVETTRPFSQYIQDIVQYILWFLAIIATLMIIYSWFNLLFSAWDEEKAKKTKSIISYAVLWLIIIFLAWPILQFVITALSVPEGAAWWTL